MNAIFGDQFYRRYILDPFKNLCRLLLLRICSSQFFQDTFYTWNAHLGTRMVQLIKPSCQAKAGAQNLLIECSSKRKINLNTFIRVFIRNKPVLALKISKRGWACI